MKPKFKIGDVVQLLSGSPRMTVASVTATDDEAFACWCCWVDSRGEPKDGSYPEQALCCA